MLLAVCLLLLESFSDSMGQTTYVEEEEFGKNQLSILVCAVGVSIFKIVGIALTGCMFSSILRLEPTPLSLPSSLSRVASSALFSAFSSSPSEECSSSSSSL